MRFFTISLFLIFVLVSSVISANFSAFAQITPRPYYTVLETPIHNPDTLYEKTPAEFTTKITNQGTAAKPRDVFVKMSHGNDVGEHNYTCDTTSGAYSQSVNLAPGESIDLHWNCEIFNPGTYTLTILDKTFTYTVVAEENKSDDSKSEEQEQNQQQEQSQQEKPQNPEEIKQDVTQQSDGLKIAKSDESVSGKANLIVTDVSIMPRKGLHAGDKITITAVVKNTGAIKDSKSISGGITIDSDSVNLVEQTESRISSLSLSQQNIVVEPGKEKTVQWTQVLPTGGTYDLYVDDSNIQFTVKTKEKTQTISKTDSKINNGQTDKKSEKSAQEEDGYIDLGPDFVKMMKELNDRKSEEQRRHELYEEFGKISVDVSRLSDEFSENPFDGSKQVALKFDYTNEKLKLILEKQQRIDELKKRIQEEDDYRDKLQEEIHDVLDLNRYNFGDDALERGFKLWDQQNKSWTRTHQLIRDLGELERELIPLESDYRNELMKALEETRRLENIPTFEKKPTEMIDAQKVDVNEHLIRIEESLKQAEEDMKILRMNDKLQNIIDERSFEDLEREIYDRHFGVAPIQTSFYLGDTRSLMSVSDRVEYNELVASDLADDGILADLRKEVLETYEKNSRQKFRDLAPAIEPELADRVEDDSYFLGNVSQQEKDDFSTISLGGGIHDDGFSIISGDVPIQSIFNDGKTEKFSVLGGTLALVNPNTHEMEQYAVAFGKGRTDNTSGRSVFLINVVDNFGEHQTITLNSGPNGDDSKVMISGSGELSNVNTMISNTIPLSDVSEKTKQNIRAKLIGGDYGQYLLYNTSTDDDVVNEWKKLQEAAIKAKEKLKQAEQKRLDSTEKFYKSKDQKIKEKLDEVTKKSAQALEKAEKDRIAWLQAKSDVEKNDAKKIYDESRNNYEKIHEKEFSPINDAYYKSGDPDLKQKMYDALDEETKSRGDAYKAEHAANEAWDKLSNETKAKLSR